jgi:hypothetical protein
VDLLCNLYEMLQPAPQVSLVDQMAVDGMKMPVPLFPTHLGCHGNSIWTRAPPGHGSPMSTCTSRLLMLLPPLPQGPD